MSKSAIIWSCAHTDPDVSNERFDWLGSLIEDIKPDYTVDLGDGADMRSLNSYDTRSPQAIVTQSYEKDIETYNEAMDRIWGRYKITKRKRPTRIGFEGNHENRIKKALSFDPRLEGTKYGISFKHLQTDYWFDDYYEYEHSAPAIVDINGILHSHYFSSGNYGTAMSGLHHGYGLLNKLNRSAICGHSHKRSLYFKDSAYPDPIIGMVVGCFKGKDEGWAGQANREWWRGVVVLRNVSDGFFDPEFISMGALQKAYG